MEKTIQEINNKINELSKELVELREARKELLINSENLVGKYLYNEDYGYIYVKQAFYLDNHVYLSGFTFKFDLSEYEDSFYINLDAFGEWTIYGNNIQYFLHQEVEELTKEEFYKVLIKKQKEITERSIQFLEDIEENNSNSTES